LSVPRITWSEPAIRVTPGRCCQRWGLGFGDVKLVAACGLLLGIYNLFLAILVSSVIASIVLLIVKKKKKDKKNTEYPFAPFLIFGMTFAMFFGTYIIDWYISLF